MSVSEKPVLKPDETNPYAWHAARFWHGMTLRVWLPLLGRHLRSMHPKNYGMAGTVSFAAAICSTMSWLQRRLLEPRVAEVKLVDTPLFVIGHWRSGTTLLHELLSLDERFTSPTTFQAINPEHFLVSGWWVPKLRFLMPAMRPMDDMRMGWDRPQEDEFALCNMGVPSPYLHLAFPRERDQYKCYLDFEGVSPEFLALWKASLLRFLQRVTYRDPRRIVLKSPPHLARVATLRELFPDARFIHIVRDPGAVFSSSVKLWNTLYASQAFEKPPADGLEEFIFTCFERMYRAFERERPALPPDRLCEVRYEDLVRDPVGRMRGLYEQLELGQFELVEPKITDYFAQRPNYRVNQHRLDAAKRRAIFDRWGRYMERYGYTAEPAAAPEVPATTSHAAPA